MVQAARLLAWFGLYHMESSKVPQTTGKKYNYSSCSIQLPFPTLQRSLAAILLAILPGWPFGIKQVQWFHTTTPTLLQGLGTEVLLSVSDTNATEAFMQALHSGSRKRRYRIVALNNSNSSLSS